MNDTIETHEEKKDRGFTLIELLIVIVILGILATVTVFAVGGITDRGQTSACSADAKTIEVAIEAYRADGANATDAVPSVADLVADNYLNSVTSNYTITAAATDPRGYELTGGADCNDA